MATLEINGRDVEVDDSFLSLTPEQQNATVEEIAASLGAAPSGLQGKPGKMDPAQGGVSQNVMGPDGQPVQQQASTYKPDLMTATAATVNGLVNSVPFLQNTSDALVGAGGMMFGKDYGETVEGLRKQREMIAQASPVAMVAGEVGGTLGTLGLAGTTKLGAEALGSVGNLGARVLNSGLSSAGLAGLNSYSQGNSGGDVLGDMALGGGVGAAAPLAGEVVKKAGGALADAVTGAAQKRLTTTAVKGAPAAADLKSAAGQMFQQLDQSGAQVSGKRFGDMAAGLVQKFTKLRANESLDPKSIGALKELVSAAQEVQQMGGGIALSDLHTLRQIAQKAAQSAEGRDQMFATQIINGIDDMITSLKPADMIGGADPKQASKLMFDAIGTWGRAKRVGVIEEAIYKAQNQGSGFENGLRIQFRQLLQNKKTRAMFTKAEVQAIEQVANGTPLTNIMRLLGKFGFGSGSASNMLGGTIGFGAGNVLGGPIGGILAAGVGTGARKMGEKLTLQGAERAAQVVATPSVPIARQAPNLLAPAQRPIELLVKSGGLQVAR